MLVYKGLFSNSIFNYKCQNSIIQRSALGMPNTDLPKWGHQQENPRRSPASQFSHGPLHLPAPSVIRTKLVNSPGNSLTLTDYQDTIQNKPRKMS